jgi:hypothetical protein
MESTDSVSKMFVRNWKPILWVSIWFVGTLLAFGISVTNLKMLELYRLMTNGVGTTGSVTEKIRENHQRIRYSFQVDGKTYAWGGFSGDIGKQFDQISLGDQVPITYETGNPENSSLGDPRTTFYPNLRLTIFISLFPTIAIALNALVSVIMKNPKP